MKHKWHQMYFLIIIHNETRSFKVQIIRFVQNLPFPLKFLFFLGRGGRTCNQINPKRDDMFVEKASLIFQLSDDFESSDNLCFLRGLSTNISLVPGYLLEMGWDCEFFGWDCQHLSIYQIPMDRACPVPTAVLFVSGKNCRENSWILSTGHMQL